MEITVLIDSILGLFSFVLGACVGSFLNVVAYRIPAELSLLWPPSRCPRCLSALGATENIPILGWLRLKGRCKHCQAPISVRYPIVEAITGLLFLAVFVSCGFTLTTLSYWVFFSWLLALSLIDLDTMTLPNVLTRSGVIVGLIFQIIVSTTSNSTSIAQGLITGMIGAVLGLWLFDCITLLGSAVMGQAAMGGGDAKLAAMIGAWLGWQSLLLASFLACAIGAIVGGGAIALKLMSRRQAFPFGPYLALGGMVTAIWGEHLLALYTTLVFPIS
jgi:leader peptidase (prepilin peptidase) / N-methyltransferase